MASLGDTNPYLAQLMRAMVHAVMFDTVNSIFAKLPLAPDASRVAPRCAPEFEPRKRTEYSNSCARVLANVEMPMAFQYGRIASSTPMESCVIARVAIGETKP